MTDRIGEQRDVDALALLRAYPRVPDESEVAAFRRLVSDVAAADPADGLTVLVEALADVGRRLATQLAVMTASSLDSILDEHYAQIVDRYADTGDDS